MWLPWGSRSMGPPRWPWCTTRMEPLLPAEILEMSSALSFHKNSFCEHLKKQNRAWVRRRSCTGLIPVLRSSDLPDAPPAASVLCSVPKCRVRAEPLARTPSCFRSVNCSQIRGAGVTLPVLDQPVFVAESPHHPVAPAQSHGPWKTRWPCPVRLCPRRC